MPLKRFKTVFLRYTATHLSLDHPGGALRDHDGRVIGNVDRITLSEGRIRVTGWALADEVTLIQAGSTDSVRPHLLREDVHAALGVDPDVGFELIVPVGIEDLIARRFPGLKLVIGEQEMSTALRIRGLRRALHRSRLSLLAQLGRLTPTVLRWYATRDPHHRKTIKDGLGLSLKPLGRKLAVKDLRTEAEIHPVSPEAILSIILPVYNAFDLLPEVLQRVRDNTDLPWRLIVIEDCSTDPEVRPWLADWVARERAAGHEITLLENPQNLGFIRSVNRGFEMALEHGGPVVLLNSDAFVPAGWASRLLAPMVSDPSVATVTPMSNDAEIFTAPRICERRVLSAGAADRIDTLAQQIDPARTTFEAPTGVGFCMAMSGEFLAKLPSFDTVFGRGYGEEVDWCQRARQIGGRHLGIANLFVEHRGGESFGSAEKLRLVAQNNQIVEKRYPGYDLEVQSFIQNDPAWNARFLLAIAWAATKGQVPIYLAHAMGGGADHWLEREIAQNLKAHDLPSIVLRVGGHEDWQVELHLTNGKIAAQTNDFDEVLAVLRPLDDARLIYSCGVGYPDPISLPARLIEIAEAGDYPIEVLFHDFYPLSPSYTLLDADGVYRGPLTAKNPDAAHMARAKGGRHHTLAEWQAEWGKLLTRAAHLTVFSEDSYRQVLASYPGVAPKLRVRPHRILAHVPKIRPLKHDTRTIAALGNIGQQKGAAVLRDMAQKLGRASDLRLVLIGNIDPAYALAPSAPVHGSYKIEDLPSLLARYQVTDLLIPSIWPETFSYTTHEALATGLPVYGFDLGAQGDTLRAAPNGIALPFDPEADLAQTIIDALRGDATTQEPTV